MIMVVVIRSDEQLNNKSQLEQYLM